MPNQSTKKVPSVPTAKQIAIATQFISRLDRKLKEGEKRVFPPLKNRLGSAVSLMKRVKLTALSWENPQTGHIIGYHRAHRLGLTEDPNSICGIVNPRTHKLVGVNRAKQLGILTDNMMNHKIAA